MVVVRVQGGVVVVLRQPLAPTPCPWLVRGLALGLLLVRAVPRPRPGCTVTRAREQGEVALRPVSRLQSALRRLSSLHPVC